MADITNLENFLTDVAGAIKQKTGKEEKIPAADFDTEILNIETGIDTSSDNPITADSVEQGKEGFVNGEKVVGTLPSTSSSSWEYIGNYAEGKIQGISSTSPDTGTTYLLKFKATTSNKTIYEAGSEIGIACDESEIAKYLNLTPEKLVKGNKILEVEGTAEIGEEINNQDKDITKNGIYTADEGYTGLGTVNVEVPQENKLTPTEYDNCLVLSEAILGGKSYRELEYIQSTGQQYIILPYKPNNDTKIEIVLSDVKSSTNIIYAASTAWNTGQYIFFTENGAFRWSPNSTPFNYDLTKKHTITQSHSNLTIDGTSVSTGTTLGAINSNLTIFGMSNGRYLHSFKLYNFKILENENERFNLIPVKKVDNTICLYDKISNTYFYNNGTSTFIGGGLLND